MKHPSTRALYDYWNRQRGGRPAPARADIDPSDIRQVLGDAFMLSADFAGEIRFRLAGTRVCALFARELKGESFRSLWSETSPAIEEVVAAVTDESIGAVAGLTGWTRANDEVELEMVLLPLASDGRTRIRAFGGLATQALPYWLFTAPLVQLELRSLRHIGVAGHETGSGFGGPRRAIRTRHGLIVHDGGRPSGKPG